MKKSINVVLASVLAFSMFSVTAFAADPDPTLQVEYPESGEVNVTVTKDTESSLDNPVYDTTYTVRPSESTGSSAEGISVGTGSSVSVRYTEPEEGSNFTRFIFYLPSDDLSRQWVEWEGDNKPTEVDGTWSFTMPEKNVLVDAVFISPTPMPSPEPTPQQNPAPSQPTPIEEPQSAVAGTVAPAPMKSVLPADTVSFSGGATIGTNTNGSNKFSATVLNLEAKDLSNQNGLAAYYAALEGKEADILATYGIYASKNLSAEDNGKLVTLTWKNITAKKLDKNTIIKAVCYNTIDGTYIIEGEIDEFGNIILKNFIIRSAKTNITVFICK